jgi:polysaccharide chain length determinant protein (PEP-CTERM system associated)
VPLRSSTFGDAPSGLELSLAIWQRRKWVALVTFAAALAVAASLAVWLPDLYRATATVLIERQQVSEALVRPSVTAELETRIQTIRQQIMSRTRLTDLIAQLGLYADLTVRMPMDAVVERMRRDIVLDLKGVEQLSGRTATIAFTVSYLGRDPELAARVANTLASIYVDENTRIRGRQATRTAEFLRLQLEKVKHERDDQERRANDFKLRHMAELPQQMDANLASLERLNTQLRLNGENQIRAIDRRERVERQLAEMTAAAAPASTPATELASLRRQLNELGRTYTDEYPDIVRLRAQIGVLEQQVREGPDTGASATGDAARTRALEALREIDRELAALEDEERALRAAIGGYEQRVENAPKRQQEYLELSSGLQSIAERYDTLLERYEEAELAANLEEGSSVEQFRILDTALPPREVAAPNRPRLLALGVAMSLGLALAALVLAERLDTAFHSVDDLRRFTTVPVLVSIPTIATRASRRRQRWRVVLTAVWVMAGLALLVAGVRFVAGGNEDVVRLIART